MLTRAEKAAIRRYHPEYQLQFRADGQTWARPGLGRAWGILYTREQTRVVAKSLTAARS